MPKDYCDQNYMDYSTKKWEAIARYIKTRHPEFAAHIEAELDFWCRGKHPEHHHRHNTTLIVGSKSLDRRQVLGNTAFDFDYNLMDAALPLIKQLASNIDDSGKLTGNITTPSPAHKKFLKMFQAAEAAGQLKLDFVGKPEPRTSKWKLPYDMTATVTHTESTSTGVTIDWNAVSRSEEVLSRSGYR